MDNDTRERDELIQGLRDLADFLVSNPELPIPGSGVNCLIAMGSDIEAMRHCARRLGFAEKEMVEQWFSIIRRFGPVKYELFIAREHVCEKKVVGRREVPAHEEEIVEWSCTDSLLRPVSK